MGCRTAQIPLKQIVFRGSLLIFLDLSFSGWWSDWNVEAGIIPFKSEVLLYYYFGVRNLNSSKSCENVMWIFAVLPRQPTFRHTQRFKRSVLWWEKGFPINFPFNPILAPCRIRNTQGKVDICCCASFPPFCKVCNKHHSLLMAHSRLLLGDTSDCLCTGCWVGPDKILITGFSPCSFLPIVFENALHVPLLCLRGPSGLLQSLVYPQARAVL